MASDSCDKLLLSELRVVELRHELEKRNIDHMGVKAVLVKRLQKAMINEELDPSTYKFSVGAKSSTPKKSSKQGESLLSDTQESSTLTDQGLTGRRKRNSGKTVNGSKITIATQCHMSKQCSGSGEKNDVSVSEETTKDVTCNEQQPIECLNTSGKPDSRYSRSLDVDEMGDMADDDGAFTLDNGEQHTDILDSSVGTEKDQIINLDISKDSNCSFDKNNDISEGDLTSPCSQNNLNLLDSKELSHSSESIEMVGDFKEPGIKKVVDPKTVDEIVKSKENLELNKSGDVGNEEIETVSCTENDAVVKNTDITNNLDNANCSDNNSKVSLDKTKTTASFSELDEHPIDEEPDFDALEEVDSEEGENHQSEISNYNSYKKMALGCEDTDLKQIEAISLSKNTSPNLYLKSDGKDVNTLFKSSDDEVKEVLNLDNFSDDDVLNEIDHEDSINLTVAEEDTKLIEEAALLDKKDSTERRDGKLTEKTKKFPESSRKGDKLHSSPDKGDVDGDGKHRNLWVCNLSSTTRATDLKNIFSKHGKVVAAKIVTNAKTPGARCYGFVSMATPEDASNCANVLNVTELHGKLISIEVVANKPSSAKRTEDKKKSDDKKLTQEKPSDEKREKKDEYFRKEYRAASEEETRRREERCDRQRDNERKREEGSISGLSSSKSSRGRSRERLRNSKDRPLSIKDRLSSRPSHQKKTPPRGALSFDQIREERERHRLYEHHRKFREIEKRRLKERERQREIERRNNEEALRLEKEREKLALERERIDRERAELLRLERERIEREKEELKIQQIKFEEARRLKREAVNDYDISRKRPALDSGRHFDSRRSPPTFDPHRARSSDIRKEVLRGGRETERSDRVVESRERDRTRRDVGRDHSSNIKERIPERISGERISGTNTYQPNDRRIPQKSSRSSGSSSSHHYRSRYESSVSRDLKVDRYPGSSSDSSYRKATTVYSGSSSMSGTKSSFPSNPPSSSCVDVKDISSWRVGPHSSDRWPGGIDVYTGVGGSMAPMGMPGPSAPFQAVDRYDAYKSLPNNLGRKY